MKMFLKFLALMVVCDYLTVTIESLTIREISAQEDIQVTTASSLSENNYRRSVAKIKETSYRVPEHLQFVAKGFIYEDADDVIHVIDPPKHFEELKKIMQRQETHRLESLRPIALREHRPKPKIVKAMLPAGKYKEETTPRKPLPEMDMQPQEAGQLPFEILASVRKTENYLRKYKPKLPTVKHRLKTHKVQTVIWEQQQEKEQFQQEQEQRVQGIKERTDANRRRFNKKRFKRAISAPENRTLKGEELLEHINELIRNASSYLQLTEQFEDYADPDVGSTTLQGEILIQPTETPPRNGPLSEEVVVKILENSLKATNVIMQQIKTQPNQATISEKCDYLKVTYPNHIKNLQDQIKCMQHFIQDINQTKLNQQQDSLLDPGQKYGKKSEQLLEVRKTKDLKYKPFLVAQSAADYIDDAAPSPVNRSLIYNDVMTTIRNMLQSQNSQSTEDNAGRASFTWKENTPTSFFAYDKSPPEIVDFDSLHEYLTSLQAIVTNLPKFNYNSANLQEIEGGATAKYYFINPQGSIYSLPKPFEKDVTTTTPTIIFHEFPDLPIVTEYLRNGTLLTRSSKVLEIL